MDKAFIENQLKQVLEAIGFNTTEPGREDTPKRMIKYWEEQMSTEKERFNWTTFESDVDEMVIVKDIHFASSCEHHLLPFFGKVHVAYIPNQKIVGISKLPRAVQFHSKGMQTQEHLTQKIAKAIAENLDCSNVAVVIEAEHTCMSARGVKLHDSTTQTSALLGSFKSGETRKEFYSLIK